MTPLRAEGAIPPFLRVSASLRAKEKRFAQRRGDAEKRRGS